MLMPFRRVFVAITSVSVRPRLTIVPRRTAAIFSDGRDTGDRPDLPELASGLSNIVEAASVIYDDEPAGDEPE